MADDYDIVKNKRAKSSVWDHFGLKKSKNDSKIEENMAVCRKCNVVVKCSGGTTNLATHLRRHHPSLVIVGPSNSQMNASSSAHKVTAWDQASVLKNDQPSILKSIQNSTKYNSKSPKSVEVTNTIAKLIIKDLRPYSMVESPEFREMIKSLDPRYQVPSRKQFSEVVIPTLYKEVTLQVKKDLETAEQVALTSDGWTSRATESYVTITSTHINDEWQMVNYVLQTRPLSQSHTGENIAAVLKEACIEWGIPPSPPIVSDNAANMLKAMESMDGSLHIPCFAHTINLAAQKSLKIKKISHVLAKIRQIVAFFHRSTTAAALLKSKASLLELPQVKLLIDVSTRWNSAYDMVSRYLELQVAVLAVLRGNELSSSREKDLDSLSNEDIIIAQEIKLCLKPLKDITTMLCSESNPTLSVIMPIRSQLLTKILSPKDHDSVCVAEMKNVMFIDFQNRYEKQVQFLNVASALDPRFNKFPYLSNQDRETVYSNLLAKVSNCSTTPLQVKIEKVDTQEPTLPSLVDLAAPTTPSTSCSKSSIQPKCALQDVLGDVYITQVEPPKSSYDKIKEEIQLYREAPSIPLNAKPLTWWKCHKATFPHIARLAKRTLQIPATSVPSERVFSTAGDIVTQQRASLKAKHVDMLIFLKKNLK